MHVKFLFLNMPEFFLTFPIENNHLLISHLFPNFNSNKARKIIYFHIRKKVKEFNDKISFFILIGE
jgi:hypothetical protein